MIANRLDGAGSSYYTMGDRKYPELKTYFDNIRATMSSVAALADEHTVVVQMVAFSEPKWQLERYLETMEEAGLIEAFLPTLKGEARRSPLAQGARTALVQRSARRHPRLPGSRVDSSEGRRSCYAASPAIADRGSTVPVIRDRLSTSGSRKGAIALVTSATMSRTSGRCWLFSRPLAGCLVCGPRDRGGSPPV